MAGEISGRFGLLRDGFTLDAAFTVPGQGVTALFGHSGSGKTTLLRCIAGLERAAGGFLHINGTVWQDEAHGIFMPPDKRSLGYVFQEPSLFPHLNVQRNLEYALRRVPGGASKIGFDEAVSLLGIETMLNRNPHGLSGGERQRVAIARALLTSPELLLMDEPLAALDNLSKTEILPYLERLYRELALPVLYITHDLREVMRLGRYILMLEQGRVIASGTLPETLANPALPLNQGEDAGVVIEATVAAHDPEFYLTYLDFPGGRLSLCGEQGTPGAPVRAAIKAADVSLSLQPENASSVLNVLPCIVCEINEDRQRQLLVKLDANGVFILARINRKSGALLDLHQGRRVYAAVKNVMIV